MSQANQVSQTDETGQVDQANQSGQTKIGIIRRLQASGISFEPATKLGLQLCELQIWDHTLATEQMAEVVVNEMRTSGVRLAGLWGGFPGPRSFDFVKGPTTIGLVPPEYREERVRVYKLLADFAKMVGAPSLITHAGFIPENKTDSEYLPVIRAIAEVAEHCAKLGIDFWLETGQETPVVLLRTMEQIGMDNLGINLDPANLILYGKGNPVDALDVIGPYIRGFHVKDGLYPTNGNELGQRVKSGQGKVDFPKLFNGLKELGYRGNWIIEESYQDIPDTIKFIRNDMFF